MIAGVLGREKQERVKLWKERREEHFSVGVMMAGGDAGGGSGGVQKMCSC